ncbi:MAG: Rieske 2Fe-2S domain-containing protein [Methanomassiliicoccales archaeon]
MAEEDIDHGKRNFLKAMAVIAAGAAVAGVVKGVVQNLITPSSGITSFPTLQLVGANTGLPIHTSDIEVNSASAYLFNYPLSDDPNFLIRLGDASGKDVRVPPSSITVQADGSIFQSPGGVGPYGSVVSYSAICQHLGCVAPIIHYYPPGSQIPGHPNLSKSSVVQYGFIHCNCHGSTYDPYRGAAVLTGPTVRPLPNVVLSYDASTDTYYAKNMVGPVIYGKPTDLSGGTPFSPGTKATTVSKVSVS